MWDRSTTFIDVSDDRSGSAEGFGLISDCMMASLYNGLGRYDGALTAAQRACEYPQELGFSILVLPELIEAASRSGRSECAAAALLRLVETTRATPTDWALGIEARSTALVSEGGVAECLYRQAIDHLSRTTVRLELARAHLLFGEWLRRENRRIDAREELRTAHEIFVRMGADVFAERAQRELLATGETVRKRTVDTLCDLTPQEFQIARLASEGLTNPEIAAELFISPRTVEWHLGKVYMKLGVDSRRELRRILPNHPQARMGTRHDARRKGALPFGPDPVLGSERQPA
jgi:DNA-binding CsgD family transcriptional regulator